MKTKILFLPVFIATILSPYICSSQVNYGFSGKIGVSNICKIDKDKSGLDNYFEFSPQYSIDGFIIEKIRDSRCSFEQGLSFESSGAEVWITLYRYEDIIASGIDVDRMWSFRTYQLLVPLKIKYDFEEWLTFYAGVSNVFFLKGQSSLVNKTYTLRGELGADVLIKKRYMIGINGGYDLLPSGRFNNEDIYLHYYNLSLKIGMLLKSPEKKK